MPQAQKQQQPKGAPLPVSWKDSLGKKGSNPHYRVGVLLVFVKLPYAMVGFSLHAVLSLGRTV
eukprot:1158890-Pelagomonas_calceolata.AAC.12